MVLTLDLNMIEDDIEEAYNQKEYLSEILYYNMNKIENPNEDN